jgi:NhaP-type Na+/H+ or K+/H+ antiporter
LVILFIFFGLLLGVVLREVNKKTRFPYTPMVVIAGMLLGYYRDSLGVIGDSTTILSGINPHMLLFIFIPVLIFESGFNCDWYIFKRAIVNILILACPGVLIGAVLLGFCIRVILGYGEEPEITWPAAMMMGSILSATDPVAVVALLKELGASVRLGTLIEG